MPRPSSRPGATDEGLAQYEVAARLDPDDFAVATDFARTLNRANRLPEAAAAYERAVAGAPRDAALLRELVDVYMKTSQPDRAAAADRPAQPAASRTTWCWSSSSAAPTRPPADVDQAAGVYRSILGRMPEAHLTRGLLAEIVFKQGRADEAIAIFRAGLQTSAVGGRSCIAGWAACSTAPAGRPRRPPPIANTRAWPRAPAMPPRSSSARPRSRGASAAP